MKYPSHLFKSERFWLAVTALLIIWILAAISMNVVSAVQHDSAGFLSLLSPTGLIGLVDLLSPGILPGILLVGALTMRNVSRH